jgi:hypothetical protein
MKDWLDANSFSRARARHEGPLCANVKPKRSLVRKKALFSNQGLFRGRLGRVEMAISLSVLS